MVALFGIAFLVTVFGMQYWYADRIYPGVAVEGVPVGGLTRGEALTELDGTLVRKPLPPMIVSYEGQQWPIAAGQTAATVDSLDAVHQAYMVGRRGDLLTRFREQLIAAFGAFNMDAEIELDVPQLRYAISQIAADVRVPARASVEIGGVKIAPQHGIDVDVDGTLSQLLTAIDKAILTPDGRSVQVPLSIWRLDPPPESSSAAIGVEVNAEGRLSEPLVLSDPRFGYELAIDPATLESMVYSKQPLRLDDEAVRGILAEWTSQIDIEPLDARLSFDPATSSAQVIQDSQMGRELDIEGTLDEINSAIADGSMHGGLIIRDRLPAVDSRYSSQMGIHELVASGTTYFAGSSKARIHNIEVAAEKFHGVVIPPNGVFSFNENVEDVTSANGFEDSLIIWGDRTAVGVGGGVCQVSTTVFRAAYEAGLPVVERYNHGYVVGWYGEPGLDATIYTPSVDFKFRNDTGAYLLLEPVVDSVNGVITFNLYGTRPDRTITISEPEISDVIEPADPIYRYDETLDYGVKEQVDWAQDGMTAKVTRTIVENGKMRSEDLISTYEPWQAVFLYGPGTYVPITPTPAPRTDEVADGVDSELEGSLDEADSESEGDRASNDELSDDSGAGDDTGGFILPTATPTPGLFPKPTLTSAPGN